MISLHAHEEPPHVTIAVAGQAASALAGWSVQDGCRTREVSDERAVSERDANVVVRVAWMPVASEAVVDARELALTGAALHDLVRVLRSVRSASRQHRHDRHVSHSHDQIVTTFGGLLTTYRHLDSGRRKVVANAGT